MEWPGCKIKISEKIPIIYILSRKFQNIKVPNPLNPADRSSTLRSELHDVGLHHVAF